MIDQKSMITCSYIWDQSPCWHFHFENALMITWNLWGLSLLAVVWKTIVPNSAKYIYIYWYLKAICILFWHILWIRIWIFSHWWTRSDLLELAFLLLRTWLLCNMCIYDLITIFQEIIFLFSVQSIFEQEVGQIKVSFMSKAHGMLNLMKMEAASTARIGGSQCLSLAMTSPFL